MSRVRGWCRGAALTGLAIVVSSAWGCESEDATEERCPAGAFVSGPYANDGSPRSGNPCDSCPGAPCEAGHRCGHTHAVSDATSVDCTCHRGHMVCCSQFSNGPGGCDYGGQPQPECPSALPANGDPCDGPQACGYFNACCPNHGIAAQCFNQVWVADESRCRAQFPLNCPDAGADAASDAGSADGSRDAASADGSGDALSPETGSD